jgi:hypothetical protein
MYSCSAPARLFRLPISLPPPPHRFEEIINCPLASWVHFLPFLVYHALEPGAYLGTPLLCPPELGFGLLRPGEASAPKMALL